MPAVRETHRAVPPHKTAVRGGSDTPSNIAGLCGGCHNDTDGVHKDLGTATRLAELKAGLYKKYRVGLLNSVMGGIIESISSLCNMRGIGFGLTDGRETHRIREEYGLAKEHYVDGYVISLAGREAPVHEAGKTVYIRRRFKKKSAANILKLNSRAYLYNGKTVAVNRHKAEGQMQDSLEEYMQSYAESHSPEECMEHLKELSVNVKPAKRTYTSHRNGLWSGIHAGDIVKYEKHNKTGGNTKSDVFVADRVKLSGGTACFGTKSRNLKYCRSLQSGCMPCIERTSV